MPQIPTSRYAGDDGSAEPVLAQRLADFAAGHVGRSGVIEALSRGVRVLVPIMATGDEAPAGEAGQQAEKNAELGVPLLRRRDGRTALLAFTGLEALRSWRSDARPSPASIAEAAQVALAEDASTLVLDIDGPVRFAIERADLEELAAGHLLVRTERGHAWAVRARHGPDQGGVSRSDAPGA
jgi:hypothetical protein